MSASSSPRLWIAALSLVAFAAVGSIWWTDESDDSRVAVARPQAAGVASVAESESLSRAEPGPRPRTTDLTTESATGSATGSAPVLARVAVEGESLALPTETSLATLDLRVLDSTDGRGLASKVELWQLDLPQDAEYQAGNHLRGSIDLPPEGGRVADLPPGRYRAVVFRRARHAEDPPEFTLRAGENQIEFHIDPPIHERWWVRIVDELGQPLEVAEERASSDYTEPQSVGFAVQRRRLGDDSFLGVGGGGGSYGMRGRRTAKPQGFDLGVWREPTAGQSITRVPRFVFDGRADVECRAKGWVCARFGKREDADLPQRHFVAVSLPRNYFDTSFCDSRGAPVQRDQVQVKVEASLIEVEPGAPIPVDRLHVSVSARRKGGNWTTWDHNVADGPPFDLHLSPRE